MDYVQGDECEVALEFAVVGEYYLLPCYEGVD